MLCDAHMHLDAQLKKIVVEHKLPALINCATAQECETAIALCKKYPYLSYSCGVHPWDVDTTILDQMMPYMIEAKIVGEIGMDCIWCEQDRNLQMHVFQKQLAFASSHKKPVILHTKGEEETIAKIIKAYPNVYLVHWYSCDEYLSLYKEMNCYFSIGPDVFVNESVQQVVRQIELDHLLIESDGLDALKWALQSFEERMYPDILYQIAQFIAMVKDVKVEEVISTIHTNYIRFIEAGRT